MTILEILDELGIEKRQVGEHEHARPDWVQIDCPRCSISGHFRLGINLSNPRASCWACGSIPLWEVLAESSNMPKRDIAKLLTGLERSDTPIIKHQGKLVLPDGLGSLLPAHKKYLRKRGFNPSVIERFWHVQGLGHTAGIYRVNDRGNRYWQSLAWRLFIPIEQRGQIVTWTTRSIADDPTVKRYIAANNAESLVPRSQVLYGEDFAANAIVVHEGATDVWAMGRGAVATLGLGYSRHQVEQMLKYPVRCICFDNEPAAKNRARQLADELSVFAGETYMVTLEGNDPASAPKCEIKKLRRMLHL